MNVLEKIIANSFYINDLGASETGDTSSPYELNHESTYLSSFLGITLETFLKSGKYHLYEDIEDIQHIELYKIGFTNSEIEQQILKLISNNTNRVFKYYLKSLYSEYSTTNSSNITKLKKECLYPFSEKKSKQFAYFFIEQLDALYRNISKKHNLSLFKIKNIYHDDNDVNWFKINENNLNHLIFTFALIYTVDNHQNDVVISSLDTEDIIDYYENLNEMLNKFNLEISIPNKYEERIELLKICQSIMNIFVEKVLKINDYQILLGNQKQENELIFLEDKLKNAYNNINQIPELNDIMLDIPLFKAVNYNHNLNNAVLKKIRLDLNNNNALFFKINLQLTQQINHYFMSQKDIKEDVYLDEAPIKQEKIKKSYQEKLIEQKQMKEYEAQLAKISTYFCFFNKKVKNNIIGVMNEDIAFGFANEYLKNHQMSYKPTWLYKHLNNQNKKAKNEVEETVPKTATFI